MKELLKKESYQLSRSQLPVLGIVLLAAIAYVLHTMFAFTLWAWIFWAVTAAAIVYTKLHKTSHIGLIAIGLALMLATPVGTTISWSHVILMTTGMVLAVIVPYGISRRYFKDPLIHFNLNVRRKWSVRELGYIIFAVVGSAVCLTLYFATTNAHENWPMVTLSDVIIIFTCVMIVGIWEEFFFIGVVYSILQRILPQVWAIILQAVFFSAFLFQIGFREWSVPFLFMYAMFQAYVFYKTKTLLVTLIIHILVDLIVFANLFLAARHVL